MTNRSVSRRQFALIGGTALLAACNPTRSGAFWGTIGAGFRPPSQEPIDPAYVKSLPYASMIAWFEGGPKALVILAEVAPGRRLIWQTAERQSITTYGAFVVSALGFELDLRGTLFGPGWTPNPLELVGRPLVRTLDVEVERERVQVPLASTFRQEQVETVRIFDTERRLTRVSEAIRHDGRRRYVNDYWIEASSGRCWKSRQTIVPTLPPLNIELAKFPTV